jgi:hypothetical protein
MKSGINPRDIDLNKFHIEEDSFTPIENQFELESKDFLDFASEDLKNKSVRDTVNALGNIRGQSIAFSILSFLQ